MLRFPASQPSGDSLQLRIWEQSPDALVEFASLPTSLPWLENSVDSVKPQRTVSYVRKKIECARMPGFGGGGPGGVKAFLSVNGHWSLVQNTRDSKTARQLYGLF